MRKLFAILAVVFAVATALAQGPVLSPQSIIINPLPSFEVEVFVDKNPSGEEAPVYNIGERIRIGVRVTEDAWIYLFNVRSNGEIQQILPNRLDPAGQNNFVRVGETKFFPPDGARYTFNVAGPSGLDKVIAVASKEPLNTSELAQFERDPNFATSNIGEQGFAQTLSIIVQPLPQDEWVTDTALFWVGQRPTQLPFGTLSISSVPSGARAFVDGQFVGFTPTSFGTRPGRHEVRLELNGYETHVQVVNLQAGERLNVRVQLSEIQRTGTVSFVSVPAGAQVRVDGDSFGTTPTGRITLTQGNYQARFSLPGYQDAVVPFTVTPNSNQTVRATLQRRVGTLVVQANVGGAQVFIDGNPAGTIPSGSGRLAVGDLPTGTYELTVVAPGFATVVREFRIRSGEVTEVQVRQERR